MTNQGQAGEEPIKPGIYEQLVTEELGRLLRGLDADLVSREPLDPADAHEVLSRHLATLVTRALRSVPAGSDKPLLEQVRLANRIVEAIAGSAHDGHPNDLVAESADVLHAIAARTDTPVPVHFPGRPENIRTAMEGTSGRCDANSQKHIGDHSSQPCCWSGSLTNRYLRSGSV